MTFSKLGRDIATGELVKLLTSSRRQGTTIFGATGVGKTGLQLRLVLEDIEQGLGVCVLDPTGGDLTNDILARLPANREEDVILLDITDYHFPFGVNLFACPDPTNPLAVQYVVDQVKHIFEKLFGVSTDTPLLLEYVRNATYTLVVNQGYTMADIPLLFLNENIRKKLTAGILDNDVKLFWQQYEQMKPSEQNERASYIIRRVSEFLQPLTRPLVGQAISTIDFRKIIDAGKILLVKLHPRLEMVSNLIGSVIIAGFLNAAYSRSDTDDFITLFTEARKYSVGLTIATQTTSNISEKLRDACLQAANLIVFRVSGIDADKLAGEFDSTPPPPEITGWRPILTPKNDVVDHLHKQGHVNQHVSAFTNNYLIPAIRGVEQNKKTFYGTWVAPFPNAPKHKILITELDEAIHQLNGLLFTVMTNRQADIPIPSFIFGMFAVLFGFSDGFLRYITLYNPLSGNPLPSYFKPKPELLLLCAPDFLQHTQQIAQKVSPYTLTPALAFTTSLRQTMHTLSIDPVLTNTGQHEPIYANPRSYQDVQNEIATRLVSLPRFTARVKISGEGNKQVEHTIQTLAPGIPIGNDALIERIQRIREGNRHAGYVRDLAEVAEEIRERQEPPEEPPPVFSRRKSV